MPSKRKPSRPAQQQNPQPTTINAQSDYDTDANFTDLGTSSAPPPTRTNTELNLAVLRRYNPDIERLVSIAPFAVVYTFSPETQQWEKCGMEGTLFVCQLAGPYPRYNVVVLNRKSLDNFVTELYGPEDIEITEEYVILQVIADDGTPQIFGLWIFSDGDNGQNTREVVAATIQECAERAQQGREMADKQQPGEDYETPYNGHQSSVFDGASYQQQEIEHAQPPAVGHQVDLSQLFGQKPSQPTPPTTSQFAPHAQDLLQQFNQQPAPQQQPHQQNRFVSTSDTDFFRTARSPAVQPPQQMPTPPQSQPPQNVQPQHSAAERQQYQQQQMQQHIQQQMQQHHYEQQNQQFQQHPQMQPHQYPQQPPHMQHNQQMYQPQQQPQQAGYPQQAAQGNTLLNLFKK